MDDRYLNLVRQDCPVPAGTHVVANVRDSGGDDQERSVHQQSAAIREYCAYHGLVLEGIYIDEARKGSNTEQREHLNEMLYYLRGRFPQIHDRYRRERVTTERPFGVIFWKSNRLGRDQLETTFIKTDLRLRGLTIIELVTPGTTGNAGLDGILESFYQWNDQRLLDEISHNVKRGLADIVSLRDDDPEFLRHNPDWQSTGKYLGILPGARPIGFKTETIQIGVRRRRRSNSETFEPRKVQRLVPDTEDGVWDRCYLAWKMRHEGARITDIMAATRLFKTPSGYTPFFKNRLYTGDLEYGGRIYTDFVPAMIPREWYEEEQKRIEARGAKLRGKRIAPEHEPRRVASRHLLSGLVFCGAKDGEEHPMQADTIPAKEGVRGQWDFYICSWKKNTRGKDCDAGRISAAALEKAVIEKLLTEVITRENLRPIADNLAQAMYNQNEAILDQIAALTSRLREVRSAIEKLLTAVEQAGWSSSLQSRLSSRESEERELIIEVANLERAIIEPEHVPAYTDAQLDEFILAIHATLTNPENTQVAREAIRRFVAKIVVNEKAGTIYYTFPLSNTTRSGLMPPRGLLPLSLPQSAQCGSTPFSVPLPQAA